MCHPLAFLNELWFGSQGHEVALDDESGVLLAKEERRLSGTGVALMSLLVGVHGRR